MFHDDRERDRDRHGYRDSDLRDPDPPRRPSAFYPVLIGGLIVTFGLTLLANNLGWTDMRSVTRQFWPFALVIFGVLLVSLKRS